MGALVACAMVVASTNALAQADEADALLAEGKRLGDAGDLNGAREKITAAWKRKQSYDIAANLGLLEATLGDHPSAAEHLDFARRVFPASGKPTAREQIETALAASKQRASCVRLTVNVDGARVSLGKRSLGSTPIEGIRCAPPGVVSVHVQRDGFDDFGKELTMRAGEDVPLDVTLHAKAGEGGVRPGGPPVAEKPLWPAFVLGGVSLVGVGVGIAGLVVGLGAKSDGEDLAEGAACRPVSDRCLRDGQGFADDYATFSTVAITGWVVGGAALTGMVIYLLVPEADETPLRVDAAIGPGGGQVGVTLHF